MFGAAGTPRGWWWSAPGSVDIAAGVKLKEAGIDTFTIYESSTGVGGTWWDNTYPGAEVDVNSNLYRYSFKPHGWTRTHARQPELQTYLEETRRRVRAPARICSWGSPSTPPSGMTDRHVWTVTLDSGEVDACHVVISAVGFLNVPRYPAWPGLEDFGGPKFHTSRWDHHHDLSGKVVAVVGTGSTATQVVPAIQPMVKKLYVFQREPGWVLPKGERDLTEAERKAFSTRPWRRPWTASALAVDRWRRTCGAGLCSGRAPSFTGKRERPACDYIAVEFADRPDLREAVTPTYPFPGKRPVLATTFYPALKKPNVELVPRAVAGVTTDRHRRHGRGGAGCGRHRHGHRLPGGRLPGPHRDRGSGGPDPPGALGGRTARLPRHQRSGVPQFLHALRAGHQRRRARIMLEAQAEYAVRADRADDPCAGSAPIEVQAACSRRLWYVWLQSRMQGTSWTIEQQLLQVGTGKIVTQWPRGNVVYRVLTKLFGGVSETDRADAPAAPPTASPHPLRCWRATR